MSPISMTSEKRVTLIFVVFVQIQDSLHATRFLIKFLIICVLELIALVAVADVIHVRDVIRRSLPYFLVY